MELNSYLRRVQQGVTDAAALADDQTKQIAERLSTAVESSVRVALIDALSDATTEISTELAPGSVELQMSGGEPEFVVHPAHSASEPSYLEPDASDDTEDEADDDSQVRFSLRLPKSAKEKADRRAEKAGVSTNTYLTALIVNELSRGRRGPDSDRPRGPRGEGDRRGPRGEWRGPRGGRGPGFGGPGFGPGPGFGGPGPGPGFRPGPGRGPGFGPGFGGQIPNLPHIAKLIGDVLGGQGDHRCGPGCHEHSEHRERGRGGRGRRDDGGERVKGWAR